ncbi:Lis-interacting protein [Heterostelium album PN500]|uniref:Lis-interacting protein n=1 Tax=Heterostelium pallidum (strain ATCC 26659 / Pp 5 / PN500) TaxID=670386 RepID=D3B1I7_HETP5|nr:Lis-interacting protein [Heterostelium album PN500]EFA85161.1 Lis-interacting protein [Heterostelium album PN500]|eukprot:XP_020437270.1 Lis-interacting protein [Heterostelium album PN500]
MTTVEIPKFNSQDEEIAYWKKSLEDKQQELDDLEINFNEYQEFSKQLEEEMEGELKACEKKYSEIQSLHARTKNEYESVQDKLNNVSRESSKLISSLQDEVSKLQHDRTNLLQDRRKLEQENDSLERRERVASASVSDLTFKLDKLMEENVWIQSELEESKAAADETIQRLREDIRDLRQELSARERKNIIKPISTEKSKRENPMSFHIPRPNKSQRQKAEDTPATGASSSLSVVSELINLVTDLESRITNFRSKTVSSNSSSNNNNNNNSTSPISSPTASPLLRSSQNLANFNQSHPIPFPMLSELSGNSNRNSNSVSSTPTNPSIFSMISTSNSLNGQSATPQSANGKEMYKDTEVISDRNELSVIMEDRDTNLDNTIES